MKEFLEITMFNENRLYLFISSYRLPRMLKAKTSFTKENR